MSYHCNWCKLVIDIPEDDLPKPTDKIDSVTLNNEGDTTTLDDTEFGRYFDITVGSSMSEVEEHFHRACVLKMLRKALTDLEGPDPLPPEDQPA